MIIHLCTVLYAGDVVGACAVGIETFENDDEPYMPMQVNAT